MTACRTFLVLPVALVLALAAATPSLAAVTTLKSVTVRTSDVPPGFAQSHVKVYTHFTTEMHLRISSGITKNQVSCALPAAFGREGWHSGLIQGFDRNRPAQALQVCASMFGTSSQAHRAYGQLVTIRLRPLVTLKQATDLPTGRIGDESAGTDRMSKVCSCSTVSMHTYEVVFRHDNVVVNVSYSGSPTFSAEAFLHLIAGENNRLH